MLYPEIDAMMTVPPNVYPTEFKYRGQDDPNPWTLQALEVNPKVRCARGIPHDMTVVFHQIGGPVDPGRMMGAPSTLLAPNLISGNQPQTFDVPHALIEWAPNPIIQRSFGQWTVAPDDVRNTIPKELLHYSSDALSQQEIADRATLAIRRAMYGR